MSEMDPILPPSLNAALTQFYSGDQPDAIFADRLEASLRQRQMELGGDRAKTALSLDDLSTNIRARGIWQKQGSSQFPRAPTRVSFMKMLRTRPMLALLVAILTLLALTGMVYALGRVTGFIPGFGFTSNTGMVYVLVEPVESTQSGITLRLDNAVSDDSRFWTDLDVQGVSGPDHNTQVFVLMPDGKMLQSQSGTIGSTQMSFSFPALPAGTQALTLYVVNLDGQNFNLALRLRPVRSGEIIPVQPTDAGPRPSENVEGLRMILENIAPASDKTVFQVSLQFAQPDTGSGAPWSITLTDKEGRVYPVKDITPSDHTDGNARIYETVPFQGDEQLTVSLVTFPDGEALPVIEDFSVDLPSFRFDPGPTPQVGQTWSLNEMVNVGSINLHVVGAKLTVEDGLTFEFEASDDVTGVMLYTTDPRLRGSTGGVPVQNKNFTSSMKFETIPTQPFDVQIRSVYFTIHGPWKIKWQPPAAPPPDASVPLPTEIPTLPPQATPTLISSENPALLEAQMLTKKFDTYLQQGPGWVHIVSEDHTVPQPGQNYPPPYLKKEDWFEIDTNGIIIRSVHKDLSNSGQILQLVAMVGSYWTNFTYGQSFVDVGKRYPVSLDLFGISLKLPLDSGTTVLRESTTCENGSPCLLITLRTNYDPPLQNPGETQAFYGSCKRVWIDLQTGQQVETEFFRVLKDGKEAYPSTSRVLLVEKVAAAPQEILNVLTKVIVP
jgi:hypothetical protein